MKTLKYAVIAVIGFFLFAACQKEFNLDGELFGDKAAGSLKDTSGNCLPVTIAGTYLADSALTDSNNVIVQINFSRPGNYTISTDSSNGFSFRGSGFVKDSGMQSISLKGTGKPVLAQQTNFSVVFDSSVCTFSIPVLSDTANGTNAVFTLAGSPNTCANFTVSGVFEAGKTLDSTNNVSVMVESITTPGKVTINTLPVNGMTFSFQGVFPTTNPGIVALQGSGVPDSAGTFTIPVTAGGTSCSFTVTVDDSKPPSADSAWQFSVGTNFYHGFIDTALVHRDTSIGNATALSFYGSSFPGPDTLFQIDILLPGNTVRTGIYNTDSANADFFLYNTDTAKAPYFKAYTLVAPAVNIQVNIKTYDPATGIITGTFSGTAINDSGQKITVTEGKIYAKVG